MKFYIKILYKIIFNYICCNSHKYLEALFIKKVFINKKINKIYQIYKFLLYNCIINYNYSFSYNININQVGKISNVSFNLF